MDYAARNCTRLLPWSSGVAWLLLTIAPAAAAADAWFTGIGDLPGGAFASRAFGISADGNVVVGSSVSSLGTQAIRWDVEAGIVALGPARSLANDVSKDGTIAVGSAGQGAVVWEGLTTAVILERTHGARGVSLDGTVFVGDTPTPDGTFAFRYSESTGLVLLPTLDSFVRNTGWDISGDGSTVVGEVQGTVVGEDLQITDVAVRWTDTGEIIVLGAKPPSDARAVNEDGSVIVGSQGDGGINAFEAYRWTEESGVVGLGHLEGGFRSEALAVSEDGTRVVGVERVPVGNIGDSEAIAFVWEPASGMRALKEVLESAHGLDLEGWELRRATGISADGETIAGTGTNPRGEVEGWVAVLPVPEPATAVMDLAALMVLAWIAARARRRAAHRCGLGAS